MTTPAELRALADQIERELHIAENTLAAVGIKPEEHSLRRSIETGSRILQFIAALRSAADRIEELEKALDESCFALGEEIKNLRADLEQAKLEAQLFDAQAAGEKDGEK